jgi:hypothetical protein
LVELAEPQQMLWEPYWDGFDLPSVRLKPNKKWKNGLLQASSATERKNIPKKAMNPAESR